MPEEISREQIGFMNEAGARATSRVPETGIKTMNVNDYIASLTDMADSGTGSEHDEVTKKMLHRAAGMYSYLRDEYGAQTVKEAQTAISQRQVRPEVVRLWVEEGMAVNPAIFDPIAEGYPEFKPELETVRKRVIDEILGRS